jgi:hypothetical protein
MCLAADSISLLSQDAMISWDRVLLTSKDKGVFNIRAEYVSPHIKVRIIYYVRCEPRELARARTREISTQEERLLKHLTLSRRLTRTTRG